MNDTGTMVSEREQNGVSQTLRALTHHHCRDTIRYLMETEDGVASRREIADHLNPEGDKHNVGQLTNMLYHKHLPKLADANLIDNDSQSGTVQYLEDETAERVLEEIAQEP